MSCIICENNYNDSNQMECILNCEHTFCKTCVISFSKCPICFNEIGIPCNKNQLNLNNEPNRFSFYFQNFEELKKQFQSLYENKLYAKEDLIGNLKKQIHKHTNEIINLIIAQQEALLAQVEELNQTIDENLNTRLSVESQLENEFYDLVVANDELDDGFLSENLKYFEDSICENIYSLNSVSFNIYFQAKYLIDLSSETSHIGQLFDEEKNHNHFLSGSIDGQVKLWQIKTGECLQTFNGHKREVRCIKTLNRIEFLTGSKDYTIKLWNLESLNCIKTYKGHTDSVNCLEVSRNKKFFMSGSHDCSIKIWNIQTSECLFTLKGHLGLVTDLKLLNEDNLISSSSDKSINIWDLNNGQLLDSLNGHNRTIFCILTTHDQIISGSADALIKIWNFDSKKCHKTLYGHKNTVTKMQFLTKDCFISSSYDLTFRIWNFKLGTCIRVIDFQTNTQIRAFIVSNLDDLIIYPSKNKCIEFCSLTTEKKSQIFGHISSVCCLNLI